MSSIAHEITRVLQPLAGLNAVLHVGLDRNVSHGRVDLLAGCVDGDIKRYAIDIICLLKSWDPSGEFSVCDDSVRFDTSAGTGGVAVCDPIALVEGISGWIEGRMLSGQRRSWAVGYWLPEALCGDLATASVLHDATGIADRVCQLVSPYPEKLSNSIVQWCSEEIRLKLVTLRSLSQAVALVEHRLCLADIAAALVRLAFARGRRYLRGFRSLEQQVVFLSPADRAVYDLASELLLGSTAESTIERVRSVI